MGVRGSVKGKPVGAGRGRFGAAVAVDKVSVSVLYRPTETNDTVCKFPVHQNKSSNH